MVETGLPATPPFLAAEQCNAGVTMLGHRSIAGIAVFENCRAAVQEALGVLLPDAGKLVRHDGVLYLWAGPENWLAVADVDDADFEFQIAGRCGRLAAVTDQSDGRAIIRIASPAAREVLAKLLPIDLHPSVFTPDATVMTLAGHIPVQIWQSPEGAFELACFRSYAETLYETLKAAGSFQ